MNTLLSPKFQRLSMIEICGAFLLSLAAFAFVNPVSAAAACAFRHKVQAGETVSSIAALYDADWLDIVEANDLKDPYTLQIDQVRNIEPEAYEAYLKGVQHRETITKDGFDAAEYYFNIAVDRDPEYAAAWAGLASVWNSRLQLGMAPRQEAYPKAKEAVLKALALDDSKVEAYRTHAGILTWADWDFEAAARAWSRMLELNPSYAPGLAGYSHFLMNMGRHKEALAVIERALELDPYNIRIQSFYAQVLLGTRRYLYKPIWRPGP